MQGSLTVLSERLLKRKVVSKPPYRLLTLFERSARTGCAVSKEISEDCFHCPDMWSHSFFVKDFATGEIVQRFAQGNSKI